MECLQVCAYLDVHNMDNVKWESSRDGAQASLKLVAGGHDVEVDFDKIAKKEHLDKVTVQVHRMNQMVKAMRENENYMKIREAAARDTSETANERVMWWSIAQILVLVGTSYWQMRHLQSFFKKKKLI